MGDVRRLRSIDLPGQADLIWGSFPCQDLSLAGGGAGLKGERSGTFYPFWEIVKGMSPRVAGPKIIALENVLGTLTSHGGRDFEAICNTFADAGYRYGALVINAALFVPQSRPRLFVVGVRADVEIDPCAALAGAHRAFHTAALQRAFGRVEQTALKAKWCGGTCRRPRGATDVRRVDRGDTQPASTGTRRRARPTHRDDVTGQQGQARSGQARRPPHGRRRLQRTRLDGRGVKVQRAEVRFDDVAGCLRTPAGGSSRQVIIVVDGKKVRSRLISSRETARLMGLDDEYILPKNYNEAYHLTGDGVAVDVVRHLAEQLFEPLLGVKRGGREIAA